MRAANDQNHGGGMRDAAPQYRVLLELENAPTKPRESLAGIFICAAIGLAYGVMLGAFI